MTADPQSPGVPFPTPEPAGEAQDAKEDGGMIWLVFDLWNADDYALWVAGAYDDEETARAYVDTFGPDGRYIVFPVPLNAEFNADWRGKYMADDARETRRALVRG